MTFLHKAGLVLSAFLCLSATSLHAEETVLIEADFSTLTSGSEDAPEIFNYSFNFTGFSGWNIVTGKTGQAGGSLYLGDGGSIKSPYITGVSTTNGAIKVTAEVKLNKADAGIVQLTYGYSNTQQVIVESADWETVEFFVTPTSASSYSNQVTIAPQWLADGMFVKSIKVAQSPDFLASPDVNQPTNADGTSFTATWKSVTGATKYFIDVYSYNNAGEKVYFIENQECTGTSYKVEGLDAATTYYFVVRAANETGTSGNSAEIEVVKYLTSLDAPAVALAACDNEGNFTAEWAPVADADSYTITIFRTAKMTEPGEATVFTESFDAFTTGTLSSIEYIYARHLAALNEPGWDGYNMGCINGAIAITPYGSDAYIVTPAIDLSANDGKFAVKVNMAANNFGTFYTNEVVSFCTVDADGKESDPVNVTIDQADFADYTVEFTDGTAATKIKISSASKQKIFFDEIAVVQTLPAGSESTSTYLTDTTEATSYTGKVEFADNTSYKLVAVANGRTVSGGEISGISSAASEPVVIEYKSGSTGIDAIDAETTISKAGEGLINITTTKALTVTIYDLNGRNLGTTAVAAGSSTIAVAARGVVVVAAGDKAIKIAL